MGEVKVAGTGNPSSNQNRLNIAAATDRYYTMSPRKFFTKITSYVEYKVNFGGNYKSKQT